MPIRQLILQWSLLLALSILLGGAMVGAGLSAGTLVGPMLAAMLCALGGSRVKVPGRLFVLAQGITACVIASTLQSGVMGVIANNLLPMLLTVALTLACAALTGWAMMRTGILPGSTGAWGAMPGAAHAMVVMSGHFGGDPRIVAVMQYLRVLIVVLSVSAVSALLLHHAPASADIPAPPPSAAASWHALLFTLLIAGGGAFLGQKCRIPAGGLLVPLVIATLLKLSGTIDLHVPYWLTVSAFCLIGWSVGLRFRRDLMAPLALALPAILLGIITLIALCTAVAWLLTLMAPVSMMTAYLATSPGGIESVVALSMGTDADLPFVAAYQTLRLFAVIIIGPMVGRWLTRLAGNT